MAPKQHRPQPEDEPNIIFSTAYSPQFKQITSIIRKYILVLYADETMRQIISKPIQCAARNCSTIGNVVSLKMTISLGFPWLVSSGADIITGRPDLHSA